MIRQYCDDGELLSVELTPCLSCDEPCPGDYCGPECYCDGEGAVECDCGEIHDETIECPACGENDDGFDGNGMPRKGRR